MPTPAQLLALLPLARHALERGDIAESRRLIDTVLAELPEDPGAIVLASMVDLREGHADAGRNRLNALLDRQPDCVEALLTLAAMARAEDPGQAVRLYEQALEIQSGDPDLWFYYGLLCADLGNFARAAEAFGRAAELQPRSKDVLLNLALAQRDSGREFDAVETFERLTRIAPNYAPAWLYLGQLLLAHGRFDAAIRCADRYSTLVPRDGSGPLLRALALSEDGRGAEAENSLRRAISLNPEEGVAHASLGFWCQEQGRFDEAQTSLERAIELNPRHGFAYYNLFRAKKASEADRPLLILMEEIAEDPRLHGRDRGYLNYALGKAYEDLGEYEAAMGRYDRGNREAYEIWLARKGWDRDAYAEGFDRTMETFTAERMRELGAAGNPDATPLLIVGMIRSGTSLLEQILSSHPAIAGAGELPFWHKHEAEAFDADGLPAPGRLANLARTYLAELARLGPGAARVTDKLPHNYAMLGLIHAAFPNARMIHVRRDPADNCLSVYTTAYQRPPVFAHNRDNIVFAYRQYQRLVAHWRATLPADRWIEVDYEDLIRDREGWTRRLIDFAGLDWDDACLRHESNQRAVRTPSLWQVRQPIYTTSIARWKRFEPWIPEFAALAREP